MKTKRVFFTEFAYVVGMIALAFGTALMEQADFGMSMVVAPAYVIHLKLSQYFPWYSFGVSEYIFQAVLLIVIFLVLGKFKKSYLFSFITAVIYGFTLDLSISIVSLIPACTTAARLAYYVFGMIFCAIGVSMFFHSYISPEAYELFVKEISNKWKKDISKVKTVYDCCSCLLGIALSFAFFGMWHFEGVKIGTILCALLNGWLIGMFSHRMDSIFCFKDGIKLRSLFEN